ncbi:MAG: chorismate dehydratase [Saprospiraceae bacterium]|nr:MAG: chorismate dehydratase [Saprospiraceae bacterium]
MTKIRITAVSYLNTKPLLYGLLKSPLADRIDLQLDIPSICAQRLKDGEVDLGLVPIAIIPELSNARIISDYCIGTVGAVKTVAIFGNCPIEQMSGIYLDYHSRTSAALTEVLLRDYWKLSPELIPAPHDYLQQISGTKGGLVIGDRTIGLDKKFEFVYDLGEVWMQYTGLPFVFAAWVSTQPLDPDFLNAFNLALQRGVAEIPQLMYLLPSPDPSFDLKEYFTHFISYELDASKRKALSFFLQSLGTQLSPSLEESLVLTM